jgi:hypothetical protein
MAMSAGDAYGFAALLFIGLAAILMLLRYNLLKIIRNISTVRAIHIIVSTLAGVFLLLHLAYLYSPPVTDGIAIGYAAFFFSVLVWISGTAFLEKLRDSLFFHGTLASVLVGLILVHAASSSPNIPFVWTQLMLAGTGVIMGANVTFHLLRAVSRA